MKKINYRGIFGIVLSAVLLLLAFPFQCFASDFQGYTPISTAAELDSIRNAPGGKYYLTGDIIFTEADFAEGGAFYNGGAGWDPIGSNVENAFSGVFDGNGYSVIGLQINKEVSNIYITYAGLFGFNKGVVKNLGMENCKIAVDSYSMSSSPTAYVGAVVAFNREGSVVNCYNTGSVTANTESQLSISYAYAGGVVGYNCDGNVVGCSNSGAVYANSTSTASLRFSLSYSMAGGVVGFNRLGVVESCFNTGEVDATTDTDARLCAGGITSYSYGFISDCYNIGEIRATAASSTFPSYAGGIVGYNDYASVENCYNSARIYARCSGSAFSGGIAGENRGGSLANCYYLNNISNGVGNGKDSAVAFAGDRISSIDTFAGFDFDNVWNMDAYPTLINAAKCGENVVRSNLSKEKVFGDLNGDGVCNSKDANLLTSYVAGGSGDFELARADINCDGTVNAKDVNVFKLIISGAISF